MPTPVLRVVRRFDDTKVASLSFMARLPKLVRALSRRVSGSTPSEPQPRAGSLPFISGDTFRSVAEIILEDGRDIVQHGLHTGCDFLPRHKPLWAMTSWSNSPRHETHWPFLTTQLWSSNNGDHVPSAEQFEAIRRIVPRVFSKNVLDDIPGVTPIPIGLENVALKHNGKLHYYLDALHNPTPSQLRTRRVLSSFHESTNRAMREPVKDLMVHSRHGHERDFAKSLDYRLEVRQTKFVISPPGNGNGLPPHLGGDLSRGCPSDPQGVSLRLLCIETCPYWQWTPTKSS